MTPEIKNLALIFLAEHDESIEEYEGLCGELTDQVIKWLGEDMVSILFIDPTNPYHLDDPDGGRWYYHMVPIVDGLVHDPWFPELVLEPREYFKKAFPGVEAHITITDEHGLRDLEE